MKSFFLHLNAKDILLQDGFQNWDGRLLPVVTTLPEVNKASKSANKEDSRTACGIEYTLGSRQAGIRHNIVQHQIRHHRRRKNGAFALLGEVLIQMAQHFNWNISKRILPPEIAL